MGLLDRFRRLRSGTVTGLEETENNAQMVAILTGPFCVGYLLILLFVPEEWEGLFIILAFFLWIAYIVQYHAYAKADATSFKAFPQSHWRFPFGLTKTFNLMVPPECYEKILEFPDGSGVGYFVRFTKKYEVQDPKLPFPYIFDKAYWKLPALWDKTFSFSHHGEFFHRGVVVDHSSCENISVYVFDWETKEGETIPICVVNDCNASYEQVLNKYASTHPQELSKIQALTTAYRLGRKRERDLIQDSHYLEDTMDTMQKEGQTVKDHSDDRMEAFAKKHSNIMKANRGLLWKLRNLKWVGYGLIFIGVLLFLYALITGWRPF